MKYTLLMAMIIMVFSSCVKDEPIIDPIPEPTIDFGDLQVGDEMYFLRFETSCDDFSGDIRFTGDTLRWSVKAMEGSNGMLTEQFTDGSPLSQDFPEVDVPVMTHSDYILMPDRWASNLFFFYGNDTLRVDPPSTINLNQDQCKLLVEEQDFRGDAVAYLSQFKAGEHELQDMTVVSCVPGSVRDAYILYTDGHIKAIFSVDFFTGVPMGWIAVN